MAEPTALSLLHADLADALLPIVLAAARVQMQHFRAGTAVTTKADRTPVTEADQASEALIVAGLAQIAPGIAVVAEEAMAAGGVPELGSGLGREFFLVDPLDGRGSSLPAGQSSRSILRSCAMACRGSGPSTRRRWGCCL